MTRLTPKKVLLSKVSGASGDSGFGPARASGFEP